MNYVLVVDDDIDIAEATAKALKVDGYEVSVFHDVQSAFNSFKNRRPDLVILDVMFPDNSTGGFELARKIAKEAREVPILMLTAVNAHFQIDFGTGDIDEDWMPVADFMEKPVNFEEMKKKVAALIAKSKE